MLFLIFFSLLHLEEPSAAASFGWRHVPWLEVDDRGLNLSAILTGQDAGFHTGRRWKVGEEVEETAHEVKDTVLGQEVCRGKKA